jgi:hypothetical protein
MLPKPTPGITPRPNIVCILADDLGYTPHNEPGELFDLRQDPVERVKAMAELLSAMNRAGGPSPVAGESAVSRKPKIRDGNGPSLALRLQPFLSLSITNAVGRFF